MLEYGKILIIHSICQKEKLLLCENNKTTGSNYDRKWRFFYINRIFPLLFSSVDVFYYDCQHIKKNGQFIKLLLPTDSK